MNRILVVAVTPAIACLWGVSAVYGASFDMFVGKKIKECEAKLETQKQEYETMLNKKDRRHQQLIEDSRDSQSDLQDFRDKNATLMEAYEKLKTDQDGVIDQLNRLRRENQRCDTIRGSFDQLTEENKAFLEEKESFEKKIEGLSATLENLKAHIKEVTLEKDQLAVFLAEAQESESVKIRRIREKIEDEHRDLKKRADVLKKENASLAKQLKASQKEAGLSQDSNTKLQQELAALKEEKGNLQKSYADLKSENRYLAQEAIQFPKKFADLARHNRKLVKETAYMHYNLGVSHIKNKDYKRAVKEFEKVLELKPDDPYANYNLGYIYAEHLVDRPTAVEYFQNYLAHASDAKDADWVRKYILTWQTWYGREKMK